MPSFQTVLFDLDGTLLDSVDLIVDSYHHTLAAHSLPPMTRTEILAGLGTTLYAVFGRLAEDPAVIAQWVATYREFNLAHHDSRARAYPGTVDMVRVIQAGGRRLGLVTSKNRSGAQRGLNLMGLGESMEVIVGADDVTKPKPDPEPVLQALERLGADPNSTIFVGDSHHDIHSGRAAGVLTAGVTWGPFDRAHLEFAAPDYYCDSPAELLTLLGF
ncbi:MAG: HAD-IA family hydrolase [Gemmatimonadota bacterium]